jgi:multidrug efflux pump subunit AcrB
MICGFLPALNIVSEKETGTIEQMDVGDRGAFFIRLKLPKDATIEQSNLIALQAEEILKQQPLITSLFTTVGVEENGTVQSNEVGINVNMVDYSRRNVTDKEYARQIKLLLQREVVGAKITSVPSSLIGGNGDDAPISFYVKGSDVDELMSESSRITDIENFTIINAVGKEIKLKQIASVEESESPSRLERHNRTSSVTVNSMVVGRPTGDVGNDVVKAVSNLNLLFTLGLAGKSLDMITMVGIIILIGLVARNAILVVDFANQRRAKGMQVKEALLEATGTRFRPILMTTLATIVGMLPIAIARGAGAEWKNGLGWVLIGGLASSMFLSLIVIPLVYYVFYRIQEKFEKCI